MAYYMKKSLKLNKKTMQAAKKIKQYYKMATLFSGAGGLDSGFVSSGRFRMLLANDILQMPAETYSRNHHHKILEAEKFSSKTKFPVYLRGDIGNINFDPLPKLDCMVGGPPCQDFSVTRGKEERRGIEVTRGKLYSHFVRALAKTQPKVFVFENVPGLISANGGSAYKAITDDFTNMNVRWHDKGTASKINSPKNYFLIFKDIVNAADVGVPQKRKRLIIIGARADTMRWPLENELVQKAEATLQGKGDLVHKYPLTALEAFEGKSIPKLASEYKKIMEDYEGVADRVGTKRASKWKNEVWKNLSFNAVEDYLSANKISPKSDHETRQAFKEHDRILKELEYFGRKVEGRRFADQSNEMPNEADRVKSRMNVIPPDMNSGFVDGTRWNVESRGMSHIYRRLHPLKPAYTVLAYGGGGTWSYHYKRERGRLTNRERARLQTFSDSYMFEGNVSEVRAQIGEAVPVRLGKMLAKVAETVLEKT